MGILVAFPSIAFCRMICNACASNNDFTRISAFRIAFSEIILTSLSACRITWRNYPPSPLRVCVLQYFQFEVSSDWSVLTNLVSFSLNRNALKGSVTEIFGAISNLTSLNLYGNQFSCPLPQSLTNATALSTLKL